MLIKSESCKSIIAGILLVAFCAATIVFQNINLKNFFSVKAQHETSVDESFNGQLGMLEEENQTSSNNTLEEEDDECKIESILFASQYFERLTSQFLVIQEDLFKDHHLEVISPPPQG